MFGLIYNPLSRATEAKKLFLSNINLVFIRNVPEETEKSLMESKPANLQGDLHISLAISSGSHLPKLHQNLIKTLPLFIVCNLVSKMAGKL